LAPRRLVSHARPPALQPVGKPRGASRAKSMQTVRETGVAAGRRRDPAPQAAWVVWVDGDQTQSD